jgi:transcriptional regulator with XRE-family HTH domain
MGISNAVRNRINDLCEEKDITINKLCYSSAILQQTVSAFMTGTSESMGIVNLKKLIDGLDMSITEFFDTDTFRNLEQEIK